MSQLEQIPVHTIKTPKAVQPRESIDEERVADFMDLLRQDGLFDFPRIDVFRDPENGRLVVADGFTRLRAYQDAERKLVPCIVHEGDEMAASWFALSANVRHGTPLTQRERKEAIYKALDHPMGIDKSQEQLAEMFGVSRSTIARTIADREGEKAKRKKSEGRIYSPEALEAIDRIGECSPEVKDAILRGIINKPEDELIAYSEMDCDEQTRLKPAFILRRMNLRDSINVLQSRPSDPDVRLVSFIHYAQTCGKSQTWHFFDETIRVDVTLLTHAEASTEPEVLVDSEGNEIL